MRSISRFEADLTRLARAVVGRDPIESALDLVRKPRAVPSCLTGDAIALVGQALTLGGTLRLARSGWRVGRAFRDGGLRVVRGRAWERGEGPGGLPPGLTFSPRSMHLLLALLGGHPSDEKVWKPPVAGEPATLGDDLLAWWAFVAFNEAAADIAEALAAHPVFRDNVLCQMTCPERIAAHALAPHPIAPWLAPDRAWVLEGLEADLAARWVAVERFKALVRDWQRLRTIGEFQEVALDAWLDAIEALGRLDLGRPLLEAARRLLNDPDGPGIDPARWIGLLRREGLRLADRSAAYNATLALVRRVERLGAWAHRSRSVGYFDEGYAGAQAWLSDWERLDGELVLARARELIRSLDPLGPIAPGPRHADDHQTAPEGQGRTEG